MQRWSRVKVLGAAVACMCVTACQKPAGPDAGPEEEVVVPTPADVRASAISATRIAVSWGKVVEADEYAVYRDQSSSGLFEMIASTTDTFFTDTLLTSGTRFWYRVRAWTGAGYSALSETASATTFPQAAADARITVFSSSVARMCWDSVAGASRYAIGRASAAESEYEVVDTSAAPCFIDSSLTGGTTYYYRISSCGANGCSPDYLLDSVTTLPEAPARVTAVALTAHSVRIAWNPVTGAASYVVRRASGGDVPFDNMALTPDTAFLDTGLQSSATYRYAVVALGDAGPSLPSLPETTTTPAAWNYVGSPGFSRGEASYVSVSLTGDTPWVAFQDAGALNRLAVLRFDGAAWRSVTVGGLPEGRADFISLRMDGSTPYLAFQDWTRDGRASVAVFDGVSWSAVGAFGVSESTATHIAFDIDEHTPYLAYQDGTDSTGRATVLRFGGGQWSVVGAARFTDTLALHLSLDIQDGTPVLAFADRGRQSRATVMRFDGSAWTPVGQPGFSSAGALYTSLARRTGLSCVAYRDQALVGRATAMAYSGSAWTVLGTAGFSEGPCDFLRLCSSGDTLYAAYYDWSCGLVVKSLRTDSWQSVGEMPVSGSYTAHVALAATQGAPIVAFRDGEHEGRLSVMRFR